MEDKKQTKKKVKLEIKNIKRLVIAIGIVLLVIVLVIFICINKKETIDQNTNLSKLNSKKYSAQLQAEYNKEGKMEEFIAEYNTVQKAVGMYILNNSTMDDDSFSKIIEKLNNDFRKDKWDIIEVSRPTSWNGKWMVDPSGNVKFKFAEKSNEPNWINENIVSNKIEKN